MITLKQVWGVPVFVDPPEFLVCQAKLHGGNCGYEAQFMVWGPCDNPHHAPAILCENCVLNTREWIKFHYEFVQCPECLVAAPGFRYVRLANIPQWQEYWRDKQIEGWEGRKR